MDPADAQRFETHSRTYSDECGSARTTTTSSGTTTTYYESRLCWETREVEVVVLTLVGRAYRVAEEIP